MNPPTPASLMEEAEKIWWGDEFRAHRAGVPSASGKRPVDIIAEALASIQAQTIRDMLDACCERCGCDEWLRSYAKDKGIEIV